MLILVIPLRRLMRLERYITGRHIDVLCRLLLTSSLFVAYAYLMDAFNTYYGAEKAEITMYQEKLFGYYAGDLLGDLIAFNVVLPQLLWFRAVRMNAFAVLLISFGVIIGMWCERFTIVVDALHRSHLPSSWGNFHATIWDWLTMAGTVGLFFFGILMVVRILPVVSMFELRELVADQAVVMSNVLAAFHDPACAARGSAAATTHGAAWVRSKPIRRGLWTMAPRRAAGDFPRRAARHGRKLGACRLYANVWAYPLDIGGRPRILLARLRSDRTGERHSRRDRRRFLRISDRQSFAASLRTDRRMRRDPAGIARSVVCRGPH